MHVSPNGRKNNRCMKDIGVQIRQRRKRLGWTIQKLAILAEVDRGFLSKLETGKSSGSWETYIKLAGALGVSIEKMLVPKGNIEDAPVDWRRIPVLTSRQAGKWVSAAGSQNIDDVQETIMTNLEHPVSTFAMRVVDDSMEPEFHAGDVVVFDPTLQPRPGDFVAAMDESGEATFKLYASAGINESGIDVFELRPLNSIYAVMRSDRKKLAILGTMIEHRRYRRR